MWPPSKIKLKKKLKTPRRRLLRWRVTLSETSRRTRPKNFHPIARSPRKQSCQISGPAKLHGKLPFVKAKLRLEPNMSPSSSLRKSSCTGEALLSTPPLEAAVSSRLPEGEASPRKRKLSEGCSESSVVQSWR